MFVERCSVVVSWSAAVEYCGGSGGAAGTVSWLHHCMCCMPDFPRIFLLFSQCAVVTGTRCCALPACWVMIKARCRSPRPVPGVPHHFVDKVLACPLAALAAEANGSQEPGVGVITVQEHSLIPGRIGTTLPSRQQERNGVNRGLWFASARALDLRLLGEGASNSSSLGVETDRGATPNWRRAVRRGTEFSCREWRMLATQDSKKAVGGPQHCSVVVFRPVTLLRW
jgi:hypothetical protein